MLTEQQTIFSRYSSDGILTVTATTEEVCDLPECNGVLLCVNVWYIVLLCVAACYSVLLCVSLQWSEGGRDRGPQSLDGIPFCLNSVSY